MMKDNDGHLDLTDRLDELENEFERLAATLTNKLADKLAKASAIALLSLAIDSAREVIAEKARAEETENAALKVNVSN